MQLIKLQTNFHNWIQHLAEGFHQTKIDPCLCLRHDCMMVTYMDGCLMFAKNVPTIDTLIQNLSNISLLEDQGAVQGYLGI